jgi:hypothetical protein
MPDASDQDQRIAEQIIKARLPTIGDVPFVPKIRMNRKGQREIEKAEVRIMKSNSTGQKPKMGLVANGGAGAWEVSIDETLEGPQQWFGQIEGPACYLHFPVTNVQFIDEMRRFLQAHLNPDRCSHETPSSSSSTGELSISAHDGSTVTLLWDDEGNDRCFVLIKGKGELRARFSLSRSDVQDITDALGVVLEELCNDGVLARSQ